MRALKLHYVGTGVGRLRADICGSTAKFCLGAPKNARNLSYTARMNKILGDSESYDPVDIIYAQKTLETEQYSRR